MPVTIEIVLKDGSRQRLQLPVETWMQAAVKTIHLTTIQKLRSVTIDPDGMLPDCNRANNSMTF